MTFLQIESLKTTNYVRLAQPKNDYWVDFSSNKLNNLYIKKFGTNFNIIIYSESNIEKGLYVIPFEILKDILKDDYLSHDKTKKKRWVATIKNHRFKVSHCAQTVDVGGFYSNLDAIGALTKDKKETNYIIPLEKNISEQNSIYQLTDSNQGTDEAFTSYEGQKGERVTTTYERDPNLRAHAVKIHGLTCMACSFNFQEIYGEWGQGFIHVHHIKPISQAGLTIVNAETDLIVLCANCHSMVHRRKNTVLSLDELKSLIFKAK